MDEDATPRHNSSVEVSVGWNSSSPKHGFQFPDSPAPGDVSYRSQNAKSDDSTDPGDVSKGDAFSMSGVLGKYSALLPGSSPPRPRTVVKKRKPESPLNRKTLESKGNKDLKLEYNPSLEPIDPLKFVRQPQNDSAGAAVHDGMPDLESPKPNNNHLPKAESTPPKTSPISSVAPSENSASESSSSDSEFEALMKATAPVPYPSSYFYNRKVRRFVIQKVICNTLNTQGSTSPAPQIEATCTDVNGASVVVKLLGSWYNTRMRRGDVLHLFSPSESQSLVASDDNDIIVIVNPDVLVSCTSVAESLSCERQVVLRNQVRVPADLNENLVLGSIKHEFIQSCFTNNLVTQTQAMADALKTAAELYSLDLQLVHLDVNDACEQLKPLIPMLQQWALPIWGPQAIGKTIPAHRGDRKLTVRLNKSVTTEEEIRSPFLGLVGKIDVTAETSDMSNMNRSTGTGMRTRLAALEIKTGRSTQSVAHRAQAALYTLLLSERHPNNSQPYSLLYYTVNGTVLAVVSLHSELKALFQKRNTIAYDLWQAPPTILPVPVSASEMSCKWCSRKDSCTLYTAVEEEGNTHEKRILQDNYTSALNEGKLSKKFLQFIKHWHHLIELEYDTVHRFDRLKSRQWWVSSSPPVVWGPAQAEPMPALSHGYTYIMEVKPAVSASTQTPITTASPVISSPVIPTFINDERVIVSTKQQMGVTFGVVVETINADRVKLWTQDKLLMTGKYRIDSDPWVSDMHVGLARFNIDSLMETDRLRELLVDLVEPQFSTLSGKKFQNTLEWASSRVLQSPVKKKQITQSHHHYADLLSSSSEEEKDEEEEGARVKEEEKKKLEVKIEEQATKVETDELHDEHSNLNEDQTMALNKVLGARDYALILGMPGTGKTTTIAAIVASLVKRGKSVLVTAYTNSAVDTLVLKLLSAKVPTMRLAASLKDLHKDVIPAAASTSGASLSGVALTEFLASPVVACTSHLTGNKLFALRNFDYCILDEASQITLPFCIGPLRLATTFVLVGDHYQLPPLVRNNTAKELGLAESLFKILCEAHPQSVVELTKQYRMCADIMSLSSDLVYDGKLVCGTESVADQKLDLPTFTPDSSALNSTAVDPNNRVVFLNTDILGSKAHEVVHTQGSSNSAEAEIIEGIVRQLFDAGLNMEDAAVISVYRKQHSYLTQLLQKYISQGLEILTADQAQGRDKKCILVSLVRSNERTQSGELLKDWRRLNVVFTRAKQKLVIVGSKRVMKCADGVARFFDYIEKRGWVHDAQV